MIKMYNAMFAAPVAAIDQLKIFGIMNAPYAATAAVNPRTGAACLGSKMNGIILNVEYLNSAATFIAIYE